ncbi:MAG: hypothetical protein GKS05_02675 [Nitrospirales bacterium]|nr:hypothetical protein [Nitrospirales bacterium]
MKTRIVWWVALFPLVAFNMITKEHDVLANTQIPTTPRYLQGRVVYVEPSQTNKPAEGLEVALAQSGDKTHTKAHGKFRLRLRARFSPGKLITLLIDHEGWQIEHPLEGELYVPEDLIGEVIKVRLRPLGAKEFLSEEHVQRMLEKAVAQVKETVNPTQEQQKMDLIGPVQEWAQKYGLGVEEVQHAIQKWAATVTVNEQASEEDLHKKGLKELAEENFGKAIEYFDHAAQSKAKRLQKTREALKHQQEAFSRLTQETVKEFRLAGDTAYNNYKFGKALKEYENAGKSLEKDGFPELWAEVQMAIASANWAIGIRTKAQAVHEHLQRAKQAYKEAIKAYEQLGQKEGKASAQVGIGTTLRDQGIRTGGAAGQALLVKAVAAYRAALEVYTQTALPQQWATTQNNLGAALGNQGTRTGGAAGQALLAEAVTAYRAALEVRTRESLPPQWAQTHNNLAEAAVALEDWGQVVTSYTNVLEFYPDYQDAYLTVNGVFHEKLFYFDEAYAFNESWLATHPDDESAKMNFAEVHLTTGRFGAAAQRLSDLLGQPALDAQAIIPLSLLKILAFMGQGQDDQVSKNLNGLHATVIAQPEDFTLGWSFEGTKYFVSQHEAFVSSKEWVLALLAGFSGTTRERMLTAIEQAQAKLPARK